QSALIAGALILLPLWRSAREGLRAPRRFRFLAYFAGLGLGFIMVEIALLQRFTLFLGEPVYTLAAVLASLLVFRALGAWLAGRLALAADKAVRRIIPAVLLLVALEALFTTLAFDAALGLPLAARLLVA